VLERKYRFINFTLCLFNALSVWLRPGTMGLYLSLYFLARGINTPFDPLDHNTNNPLSLSLIYVGKQGSDLISQFSVRFVL
jgi:hypothetical protein